MRTGISRHTLLPPACTCTPSLAKPSPQVSALSLVTCSPTPRRSWTRGGGRPASAGWCLDPAPHSGHGVGRWGPGPGLQGRLSFELVSPAPLRWRGGRERETRPDACAAPAWGGWGCALGDSGAALQRGGRVGGRAPGLETLSVFALPSVQAVPDGFQVHGSSCPRARRGRGRGRPAAGALGSDPLSARSACDLGQGARGPSLLLTGKPGLGCGGGGGSFPLGNSVPLPGSWDLRPGLVTPRPPAPLRPSRPASGRPAEFADSLLCHPDSEVTSHAGH